MLGCDAFVDGPGPLSANFQEQNVNMDCDKTNRIIERMDSLDSLHTQVKLEREKISKLDRETLKIVKKISEQRRMHMVTAEEMSDRSIQKKIRVKENKLNKAMVKFNQQLTVNAKLRQEIENLRKEKGVFDGLFKGTNRELEEMKRQIEVAIREVTHASEERNKAHAEMLALKQRNERDIVQYELEMKDLQRVIHHDNQTKEFMMIKSRDRAEYKEVEDAKKNKNAKDMKTEEAEKEQMEAYEKAFREIQEVTGKKDIDVIVNDFLQKEEENFSLFKYVIELKEEVELLHQEISVIRKEIQAFQDEDARMLETGKIDKKDLQKRFEKATQEVNATKTKMSGTNEILSQLTVDVKSLFDAIGCDSSTIKSMLGSDGEVTERNIMKYMGMIEQKTIELLQRQQYLEMKKNPPEPEKKENKEKDAEVTTPVPKSKAIPPVMSIVVPTSQDDEEIWDMQNFEDIEILPFDHEELRNMAAKTIIQRKQISTQSNPGRSKSPKPL